MPELIAVVTSGLRTHARAFLLLIVRHRVGGRCSTALHSWRGTLCVWLRRGSLLSSLLVREGLSSKPSSPEARTIAIPSSSPTSTSQVSWRSGIENFLLSLIVIHVSIAVIPFLIGIALLIIHCYIRRVPSPIGVIALRVALLFL